MQNVVLQFGCIYDVCSQAIGYFFCRFLVPQQDLICDYRAVSWWKIFLILNVCLFVIYHMHVFLSVKFS